jgi:hypothetical protein
VTPAVVGVEYMLHGRTVPSGRAGALLLACLGVAITTRADATVTTRGLLLALAVVPPAALYKVKVSSTLRAAASELDAVSLLLETFPTAVVVMALAAPLLDDLSPWSPGSLWQYAGLRDPGLVLALVVTAVLSPLLHASAFLVLQRSDALGHVLIGQVKMCFLGQ